MKHKSVICLMMSFCLLLPLAACGENEVHERQLFSMDTVMALTAYGKNGEAGLDAAIGVINSLDAMLDPELSTSETYKLNHADGESLPVSGQLSEMLRTAYDVYEQTGGALDLTIYPLVKAWGFVDANYRVPTDEEIESLLEQTGFSKLTMTALSGGETYLVTMPAGMELSFASVAKGCASKYAISALRSAGVDSAILSLGGNVQTLGVKPDRSNWNIAIQDPLNTEGYAGVLSLGECAAVTAGGYQRYFYGEDNVRYTHIIDPSTGRPAETNLLSATVVAEDAVLADALSTALCVLGEDGAVEYYLANGGFDMVLITDDNRVLITSGLIDAFELSNTSYTVEMIRG